MDYMYILGNGKISIEGKYDQIKGNEIFAEFISTILSTVVSKRTYVYLSTNKQSMLL